MTTESLPSKILVVSGSARSGALTRTVLKLAEVLARKRGFDTQFFCAREMRLPIFGGLDADNEAQNVQQWRSAVQQCAGLIVGSPEYHGTFSGAFKNLIDHLDFPHIEGKPVGLVAVGGGAKSGISTLNAMRVMFRALHVPVIVEQAAVWEGDFLGTNRPTPELVKQMMGVVNGLSREIARCSKPT